MAVTVLTDGSVVEDARTLTWTIPSLASGDVVVVVAETWDGSVTLAVPSGTGLTFTQRANITGGGKPNGYIWTAVASSGGSSVVVTTAPTGGTSVHTGVLYQFPTADGYSLGGTPNTVTAVGDSATLPQASLTGASGNIGVTTTGDWNGNTGAVTWLNSGTADLSAQTTGTGSQYYGRITLTGSTTTVGLSAPTSAGGWNLAAIEVIVSAPPASADTVHAHWQLAPPGRISPAGRRRTWTGSTGEASGTAEVATADTAAGADTGNITAATASDDPGAVADVATLNAAATTADTSTAADTATPAAAVIGDDTASGADTTSLVVSIAASDTAAGVDAVSNLDTGATAKSGTDAVAGVETSATSAATDAADITAASDAASVTASHQAADTAVAAESAVVTVILAGTESASATDLAALAAVVAAAELATVMDSASWVDPGVVIGPTPPERIIVVAAETRVVTVPAEDRTTVVPPENRTMEA